MPETPHSSSRFERLSPLAARIALALFALLLVAGVVVSLGMTDPPRRPGPSDLDTYERVVDALRAGAGYYPALHEALLAGGYGTVSPLNWRMPTFLSLLAMFPDLSLAQMALGLFTALAWGLGVLWGYRSGGVRRALGVGVALAISLVAIAAPRAELSFELFAGTLILISFAAYGLGWRWIGVPAAALALFVRELSVLYVIVCIAAALGERRRGELAAWAGVLPAFGAFYLWHARQAMAQLGAADHAAAVDWLQFGGLEFVIRTASFNGLLLVLPYAAGAVALALGLVGLLRAPRALAAVLAFVGLFLVYGRPQNDYWGALYAPLIAIGVVLAPGALSVLLARARRPRSS